MAAGECDAVAHHVTLNAAIVVGLIACALCCDVTAQTSASGEVIVRVYNVAGVPATQTEAGESVAAELLTAAGIHVRWRNCRTVQGPAAIASDACDGILNARELIVRVVRAPRISSDNPDALGYSDVDVRARMGTLATVFADRVHALAAERYFDEEILLGRAIAHEMGHLLLGVVTNPKTGLMRGHWVTDIRLGDWTFS